MHKIKTVFKIAFRNIQKWLKNPRIITIAVFVFITMLWCDHAVIRFSEHVEMKITPWVYPFIITSGYMQVTMLLCCIFLFSDAPFLDESAPYVIARSGRTAWMQGQLLYIAIACLLFTIYSYIASILPLLGHIKWKGEWGKVIGTLAQTNAAGSYNIQFRFHPAILFGYTPIEATLLTLLLNYLLYAMMGILMFVLNFFTVKMIGTIICCGITMFNYFISNFLSSKWFRFSPISFSNLTLIDGDDITLKYSIIMLIGLSVLLVIISMIMIRKKDLSAIHEQ
jgi:hypothetical protein